MARSKKSASKAPNRQKKRAQTEGTVNLDHLIQQGEHYIQVGKTRQALPPLEKAVKYHPDSLNARLQLSHALFILGHYQRALGHSEKLVKQFSNDAGLLAWHASILEKLRRDGMAIESLQKSLKIAPQNVSAHNNIATLYVKEGNYLLAEQHFQKAWELQPDQDLPRSNMVVAKHYNPGYSAEELYQDTLEWERLFAPALRPARADTDRAPQRRLRLGLISGGLRMHPVGQMILPAFQALETLDFEIFVYATNEISDALTEEFKQKAQHWHHIGHLSHEATAEKIRADKIDILVDLNGAGEGSRFKTLILEPAPLQIKWVGSLFNTSGLSSMDYLISDMIETPEGVDQRYTEKLIRMPDDYICYHRPEHAPATSALPALKNGHITFGCLNNPAKLNNELLAQWAKLLHDVTGSRLLLRGNQFENSSFCYRIRQTFKDHGIEEQRLILEGPTKHQEFLATYNRIDIALDTWPYSGGLTTCEALLMGVPVVTLPGPTFAGRHSATHLTNAGMPELVTHSWDEYLQRAVELAANLPDLSVIRACLRTYLLQSPVCDGPRFAKHLTTALRAIWQRHCEGKAPAALTFNKEGEARFEGDEQPVEILSSSPLQGSQKENAGFQWNIDGKIIAIDNGASLTTSSTTPELMKSDAFALIAFDPASKISDITLLQTGGELHHYPHTLLGDGNPTTLHVCMDPAMSATLEPLLAEELPQEQHQGSQVLTTLPIQTIQLDSIEGLESIDWLILDNLNDSLSVLKHGEKALRHTLLIQTKINFQPSHQGQPELGIINDWMIKHGFSFYRLHNPAYHSHLPRRPSLARQQATQLISADALYIPDTKRIAKLNNNQLLKLSFILDTAYGTHDLVYNLLNQISEETGEAYLKAREYLQHENNSTSLTCHNKRKEKGRFVHICFNNMHVQPLVSLLQNEKACAGFAQHILIERGRSVPGYDVDISSNSDAFYFDHKKQLDEVLQQILVDDVVAVFFHGIFFDWQKQLVEKTSKKKKAIWMMWGGDLYGPIKNKNPIFKTVKNLYGVATWWNGDYELFCNHYGTKKLIPFSAVPDMEFAKITPPKKKGKTIFVGNSGDQSNCHIEILENLAKKEDIKEYELIIPLAYNLKPDYLLKIKMVVSNLGLSNQTEYIEKLIPSHEYFQRLSEAELLITAHHRQQGGSNITASLYYGNITILRKNIYLEDRWQENPVWTKYQEEINLNPIALEDFFDASKIGNFSVTKGAQLAKQQADLLELRGQSAVTSLLKNTFENIHNHTI